MATHGHVTFYELNGKRRERPIHCYTWHDGHRREAVEDLLQLPINIFKKQREAFRRAWSEPEDLTLLKEGYWVYDQHMEFSLRHVTDNPKEYGEFEKEGVKWTIGAPKPWSREYIYSNWLSMIPLQTCCLGYANWFCQQRFNRWNIVPSLKWCSYPGTDISVLCTQGRLNGYTIEWDCGDADYADEEEKSLTEHLAALNSLLPNEVFIYKQKKRFDDEVDLPDLQINCHYRLSRDENTLRIIVPFDVIWCELFWKDVEQANRLIAEGKVSEDPYLERAIKKAQSRWVEDEVAIIDKDVMELDQ